MQQSFKSCAHMKEMERIHLEINKFEMEINKFEFIHLENNKFEIVPANLLHYNEIIFSI